MERIKMIPFEKAYRIMMETAEPVKNIEKVPLIDSGGRVLAGDIRSDVDMPPFNKSAMDGFACRLEDTGSTLEIIETIPAGREPDKKIGPGQCSRIMTGAVVPEGADTVVMVEHTEVRGERVTVTRKSGKGNICYRAEDVAAGDLVLKKGTVINAPEAAVLAAVGVSAVPVIRKPVLGIIATGSELVEPESRPGRAGIRNSNSYQLCVQIGQAGFEPRYLGIAEDRPEAIAETIEKNRDEVDIFLLSGGVSMGEYDFVPGVLREKGYQLLFEKIAIKPGKPTVYGKGEYGYVFGLPGNPVSTFIIFEILVKPFCFSLMGHYYQPRKVKATLAGDLKRRKSVRLSHIPVRFNEDGKVERVDYHGSAHIHAYTVADGFIAIPVGTDRVEAGSILEVILI
ncbi:MAG: molybdopterin molybdenumtransferase MoeA [Candidatus Latescibacteria bacterium]|nr:molybdopterin molybdenumtransferase MoeA [bacterium]MBD3425086.1 molybdopterin molybdenumtransferase MoeA [Candidatus Latescibacterota bacterium]